ncbi:MAG: hypothetical protein ABDH31_02335 [Chlorobiota bacterium]
MRLVAYALSFCFLTTTLLPQTQVAFLGGLATPSEAINDVYNTRDIRSGDTLRSLVREAVRLGYQLGVRTSVALSERFRFLGGISLVRFPTSRLYVTDPQSGDTLVVLVSVQNLVPICLGIEFVPLPYAVRLSLSTQLSYTILNSSTDLERGQISVPLVLGTRNEHRIGVDAGIGLGTQLGPVGLGLEARYAIANLVGRSSGEGQKRYLSVLLLVALGL